MSGLSRGTSRSEAKVQGSESKAPPALDSGLWTVDCGLRNRTIAGADNETNRHTCPVDCFATRRPAERDVVFITSAGSGDGANLGGLAGADARCKQLADASGVAGASGKTWHAYLSAKASGGQPAVNAKDRIGNGPWYNAKGVMVAQNVADLHSDNNKRG